MQRTESVPSLATQGARKPAARERNAPGEGDPTADAAIKRQRRGCQQGEVMAEGIKRSSSTRLWIPILQGFRSAQRTKDFNSMHSEAYSCSPLSPLARHCSFELQGRTIAE